MGPMDGIPMVYQGANCEPCWAMLAELLVGRMIDVDEVCWVVVFWIGFREVTSHEMFKGMDMGCVIVVVVMGMLGWNW